MATTQEWSAPTLQQNATSYVSSLMAYLISFEAWRGQILTKGPDAITQLYLTLYPVSTNADLAASTAKAQADAAGLFNLVDTIWSIIKVGTAQADNGLPLSPSGQQIIDGTAAGFATQTVTVQPGQKAYIVDDPEWQKHHDQVGNDKGALLRSLGPDRIIG